MFARWSKGEWWSDESQILYQAGEWVPCFTALRSKIIDCVDMLTRAMWFWKSPVSMFFEGHFRINPFLSRKHGTLTDQSQSMLPLGMRAKAVSELVSL